MPATPLTIDCRAAANRMAHISNIGGNTQMIRKLVYEDSRTLYDLMAFLLGMGNDAPDESGPGGYYSVTLAQKRVSSVMECEGNLQLHALLIASSLDVIAACDFVDAAPSSPRLVGTTLAMNKEVDALVMITPEFRPIGIASGDQVMVTGSTWLSIDGQWWEALVVDASIGQFRLVGSDTTGEEGFGAGVSIYVQDAARKPIAA
jgi:hypothetical protein